MPDIGRGLGVFSARFRWFKLDELATLTLLHWQSGNSTAECRVCRSHAVRKVSKSRMDGVNGVKHESPRKRLRNEPTNKVTVVLGAQWGDEGKGKLVDIMTVTSDVVCRCQVSVQLCTIL